VNDNRPILDRGLYVYSLLETAPTGFILNDPPIIPFDGDTVNFTLPYFKLAYFL
jgi:hypothetical protein